MTYTETLDYLYSKLPMFHRVGAAALKPDLTNTLKLCKALGNPETKFRAIHIAGTNGKGSVSHFLSSVLQEAGYKTGLYTSPHLIDFRERIRIKGEMIEQDAVTTFVEKLKPLIESIQPSFFEVTVAMSFNYFASSQVDFAVIETGLGGRLDSTNVIHPILSVITNISYDHQYLLGNTLAEIASEKAGIIKKSVPVVIGKHHPETSPVFSQKAHETNSELYYAEKDFEHQNLLIANGLLKAEFKSNTKGTVYDVTTPLPGMYQLENIKTVLRSVEILSDMGIAISKEQIINGLKNVKKNTGLKGRWEILGKNPLIVCDVAHNEAGLRAVFEQVAAIPHRKLHIVYGMVQDKDIAKAIALLPKDALYYFSQPNLPRALDKNTLYTLATKAGLVGNIYPTIKKAYATAVEEAAAEDIVLAVGSVFVAGEVLS